MTYLQGQPSREKVIAYCHNPKHVGYLSIKLIKCHKCLEKQCKYFHPYEDKPYWVERRRKKQEKRLREYIRKGNIEGIGTLIAELIYKGLGEENEQERDKT